MLFVHLLLWAVVLGLFNATGAASNTTKPSDLVRSWVKASPSSTTTAVRSTTSSAWRFQYTGDWVNDPCTSIYENDKPFYAIWNGTGTPEAWDQLLSDFKNDKQNPSVTQLRLDEWLWERFAINLDPQCYAEDSNHCGIPPCLGSRMPAAAQNILSSFSYLNQCIRNMHDAFVDNQLISSGNIGNFVQSFAQRKDELSEENLKIILDSLTFLIGLSSASLWNDVFKEAKIFPQYLKSNPRQKKSSKGKDPEGTQYQEGNERSVWKDVSSASIAFGMTGGKDRLSAPTDPQMALTDKMMHYAAAYFNSSVHSIQDQLEALMWGNESKYLDQVNEMMQDGGMLNLSAVESASQHSMQSDITSLFWGSMLPRVWDGSDQPMHPVILRIGPEHWTCGDEVQYKGGKSLHVSKWNPGRYMDPGSNVGTHYCDNDDNSKAATFWLLNANYPKCNTCVDLDWVPFTTLKGGENTTLNGETWGISLDDIIISSFGGFMQNNKRNGYALQSGASTIVGAEWNITDSQWPMLGHVRTPGFFNFTICLDPEEARNNIMNLVHPPCGTVPQGAADLDGGENSAGFVPGWCTVHITQFQPDQYKAGTHMDYTYINPLNEYQLAITIFQGDGHPIAYATKQPVDGALSINSTLPYPLIVQDNYKGSDDSDWLSFWYNDQWWLQVDQLHQCNIGKWDHGKREGNCGFTCNSPEDDPAGTPPRAVPSNAVQAFMGTGSPSSFGNAKDYAKGKCQLHIRQYQQNELTNDLNAGTYAMELTLYDDDEALIAYTEKTNRAPGEENTVNIQGPLPWIVECYNGKDDSTPPTCKYGAQDFTPKEKGWKDGLRDFDIKFDC
ncbi:uncharacterized protein N7459_000568 [Penicillium hispanicum]|uniref:uncharacterized protein n=1 Tax=Penicillium hispanicum TaxID=1080232 RepID=UPI0025413855|nr:uncharacterized protein N7459_000568 [Penicillium hispanicum]KAJ5594360.1 hypothetical protein N7459_000568 [Penicillium hispanicum]